MFERLESRQLMSAVAYVSQSALYVVGDAGADNVRVRMTAATTITAKATRSGWDASAI